jgi:hypothetical protein
MAPDIVPPERANTFATRATVPVASGKVIVLSAVGSSTVKVVSWSSGVAPSKTMLASTPAPVMVGLVIVGEVKVLRVRVCKASVPTTLPSPVAKP